MTVVILRNLGREWPQPLRENERCEVHEELGAALVQAGLAEVIASVGAAPQEVSVTETRPRRKDRDKP